MQLKILIVDDSAFMRNMLKNLITSSNGNVVGEAVDGNDAIVKFNSLNPDLVFLDIMMPNKNGLDALKEIIGANDNAKVVMCTSVGQEKVVMEAVESGASDYIVKPFKQDDIKAIIEKYAN